MKAHRTDGLSLTFGLIFLAIVAWWLTAAVVDRSLPHLGWFVACALIVLGLLTLVGAVRGGRESPAPPAEAAADPAADAEPAADTETAAAAETLADRPAVGEPPTDRD